MRHFRYQYQLTISIGSICSGGVGGIVLTLINNHWSIGGPWRVGCRPVSSVYCDIWSSTKFLLQQ